LERLGTNADVWSARIQQMQSKNRLMGCFFATDRDRLRELAASNGRHHLDNVAGMV
jgi:hypothetical protein